MHHPRTVQSFFDARGPDVRFCHSCRHAEPAWHLHSVKPKASDMRWLLQQAAGGALGAAAAGAKGLDRCSRCAQAHSMVSPRHMTCGWEVCERSSTADGDRGRQHRENLLGRHAGQEHEHILPRASPCPTPCRATATLWGIVQGNVDYSRRAASLQGASKDKLLYHVAIGSNCNKDVSSGCFPAVAILHLWRLSTPTGRRRACIPSLQFRSCQGTKGVAVCWQVLEGRRNVKPRKSMPCRIEGYELTFNHRGLPYW